MLDLKKLEKNFDTLSIKLENKKVDKNILLNIKNIFKELKIAKEALEKLQAFQNKYSKLLAQAQDKESLKAQLNENKTKIASKSKEVKELEDNLENLAHTIPNIPFDEVIVGEDENDNIELKRVLDIPNFDFAPKEHFELDLGFDFVRGVKISQSRFSVLKNDIAMLNRALINYMIDFNILRGFKLVNVPYIVNYDAMFGTGQLPKFEDDMYKIENEDLYLISTSEIALTNLFSDEIIKYDELPIKMSAYSACFRKEAGSAGKDTRGIIRQHQFEKIELVSITTQDQSEAVFDEMLNCASDLLASLGLAHRHMMLCTGDLGFSAAKTVDLEVWLPGQGAFREISSISNCSDFQARRAKIRYKDNNGKNILAHTLNGSSLAVGRTLVALIENYQQKDGSIKVPQVLKKYL